MQNKVTQEQINKIITESKVVTMKIDSKTTLVHLTTKEGFVIIETSSCVDPDNFDMEIGKQLALKKITDKLWAFEGYYLQKQLYQNSNIK